MGTIDKAVQKSQEGQEVLGVSGQENPAIQEAQTTEIQENTTPNLFEKSSFQENVESLVCVCRNNWLLIASFTFLVGTITGLLIGYSVFSVPAKTGDRRVLVLPSSAEASSSGQVVKPPPTVQPVQIEKSHVCEVVSDGKLVPKKEYLALIEAKKSFKAKSISEAELKTAEMAASPKPSGEILKQVRTSQLTPKQLCGAWVQETLQANYFSVK